MRNQILEFVKQEIIGPDPRAPHIQENGEEIVFPIPPHQRYSAGILFPGALDFNKKESLTDTEEKIIENLAEETDFLDDPVKLSDSKVPLDPTEDIEEEIGLANNFLPSAMGFSCFVRIPKTGLRILVNAATYSLRDYKYNKMEKTIDIKAYYRIPISQEIHLNPFDIPVQPGKGKTISLSDKDGNELKLKLHVRNRTYGRSTNPEVHLLTFTLINDNEEGAHISENCYFQVSFSVSSEESEKCFLPYKTDGSLADKDDEKSNRLLYRNKSCFAVGHGCSPVWNDTDCECTERITADIIPVYEIKPIVPNDLRSIELKMFDFSDLSDKDILVNLESLNNEYGKWIDKQDNLIRDSLSEEYRNTAKKHLQTCRDCLLRMRYGVELIKTNRIVNRAFRMMNRAMLLQQLHYSIDTRNWIIQNGIATGLKPVLMPSIINPETWKSGLGSWRPFQLAFILMNLRSLYEPGNQERQIVDLIWFPTGGGKTEAYLGLSAFTIFLKRLNNPNDSGTTILMRYTLRLLTAQQFMRAATLICACDKIRSENPNELGWERITIGLWVGESLTPNSRDEARKIFKRLEQGKEDNNPFVILKCPWCGAQMGYIKELKASKVKGYKRRGTPETIVYLCDNEECDFSKPDNQLPLYIIDEDIYDRPPTIMIGTVDKFAMLPWKPEARTLFGFRDNSERVTPPELIIQDELHLISGPLGSMVGLYETMIEDFCTINGTKPKIIASSATISRAREQINALYGRGLGNVSIFPPQCINAGDTFFAYEDKKSPGRQYIGIFASALPSHATAQVRILSALLQSVKSVKGKNDQEKDPYWTVLSYFNSLRELGHAATLIRADIREYMNAIWIRKGIVANERRFINRDIELTSRIENNQIPEALEELSKSFTADKFPVDICLATNMISVGIDISRLGLMVVTGQPKTTSEYIQATSRVGRSKSGPGLVFTIYNCSKPRDRSHYERFQDYHSKIYSKVEPTSVTPFSTPARERALHALLVGLVRFYSKDNLNSPRPFPPREIVERITELIYSRINSIEPEEYENAKKMIEEKLSYWENELPFEYGSFGKLNDTPLIYPAGTTPSDEIKIRAWATPTSMRNVDSTCDAIIINQYVNSDSK